MAAIADHIPQAFLAKNLAGYSLWLTPWKNAKCRGDTQSLKNANLYISEQTRVSRKSKIDLQQKERFAGSPSPGLFSMASTSAEDIEDTLTNLLADQVVRPFVN